jgi:hypothetical protein
MEASSIPTNTEYKQVTVDVPEDRIAEFHAFFARFLAGRSGRGPRGRHGRPHHRHHGHHGHERRCAERRDAAEQGEATGQSAEISEV